MVFSEWPLGVDPAQAEYLASRAVDAGVQTVIGLGFPHDLDEGTTVAPTFGDAVRLHRLVDRIAGGASNAGAVMAAEHEEDSCALQS
ncbi:hypothetical protein ACXPWS_08160 [Mycobacterium sp. BMJ-28]